MALQPLVSIIIPTFNRAHLLGETLDSVLAQTYANWECLVVDDGSTDGTAGLLKAYIAKDSRFQYHNRPDSHLPGGNGARNYGLEICKGEYIQWFDDDDVMLPGYLSKRLLIFNTKIDLVICSGYVVTSDLQKLAQTQLKKDVSIFKQYIMHPKQVYTPSVLFKKQFFENHSLFSNELLRSQEAEFFSRLFFKLPENRYRLINSPLFLYRQHENTKSAEDRVYRSEYKKAHFFVHSTNLTRGILLKDADIITTCYKNLIKLLFEAISNKDHDLIENQLTYLHKVLSRQNYLIIKLSVHWLKITRLAKYKIKYYLMQLDIHIKADIENELLISLN